MKGKCGNVIKAPEKGWEFRERQECFGERMGVWGKVRVLWRKDGNVEKGKSSLDKGW
jgi:hypothetical protein